jgi:tRNA A-37 threonylcarbamoyl transferase component Bud32
MTPERFQIAGDLYDQALELEPERRDAFLREACAGDEELRREVESLLAAHESAEGFIDQPAIEIAAGLFANQTSGSIEGKKIGNYQALALLGKGGMGEVYLANDLKLGRKVALKFLSQQFLRDPVRVKMFEREARAASALNHPNIITIFDIGQFEGAHFIVSEYVEGQTIRQRLKASTMPLGEVMDVAVQTADALAAAHEAGIVHRDIKPENVMVRRDGYVKVLDFGLAKLTEPPATNRVDLEAVTKGTAYTLPGVVMGTAAYMSPEQARGETVDSRSDVFSLGVLIYEMVAGKTPFTGATTLEVLAATLEREPLPLTQSNRRIPAELERIVAKALRKDRRKRYQTIRDMLVDLESLKQQLDLKSAGIAFFRRSGKKAALLRSTAALALAIAVIGAIFFSKTFRPSVAPGPVVTPTPVIPERTQIEFWQAQMHLGPLQRWMRAIRQVVLPRYVGRVVIFVDEIDAVRSLPFSTDEFFAGIREFYNARTEDEELERLTFCLLGVATPSDLIRDTRTTPFNIGQRIELHDFADEEAAPLAQGLRQTPEIGAALLKRALHWTSGHPYLTQRLCQAMVEEANASTPDEVDRLCKELFLSEQAQERDDNLLFVRERMLRSEVDLAGLLGLYAQVRRGKRVRNDVTNPSIGALRLSGITRVDDGCLRVRNRIYERVFDREWAKENMPDAEARRQREAYRRGLLRAAAVAAVIIAMIAGLAFLAIQQRNFAKAEAGRADRGFQQASLSAEEARKALAEAELRREEAVGQQMIAEEQRRRVEQQEQANRRLLYTAQMNVAQQDWETANIGRMERLLADHIPKPGQEDFRGFEWYYLWRLSHRDLFTWRHADEVYSGAFSPDGRKLATSGGGGHSAKLWDVATGRELATLRGHTSEIRSVAFSPDGKRLASAGADRTVRLWDAATGRELATLSGHTNVALSVAFAPDGKSAGVAHSQGAC